MDVTSTRRSSLRGASQPMRPAMRVTACERAGRDVCADACVDACDVACADIGADAWADAWADRRRAARGDAACTAWLKQKAVRQIAHTSTLQAENSCDLIRLRVKSDLKFGCSMRWSNKQRSIAELNSDSHSKKSTVKNKGRQHTKTTRSCGFAPSAIFGPTQRVPNGLSAAFATAVPAFTSPLLRHAGFLPASDSARLSHLPHELARRAEFISVSGSRAARSALRSDLRLKRTSGPVAATPQLHAPMNSPDPRAHSGADFNRVSINLNAIA